MRDAALFRSDDGGATYVEVAKLTDPTLRGARAFGSSVAIDGGTMR